MAQSSVNLRALRDFSAFLARRSKEIKDRSALAKQSVEHLSEFWSDARFVEFEKVFSTISGDLDEFLRDAEKYRQYLNTKVALGERFLRK
jgi:uncharacterized protein YukE